MHVSFTISAPMVLGVISAALSYYAMLTALGQWSRYPGQDKWRHDQWVWFLTATFGAVCVVVSTLIAGQCGFEGSASGVAVVLLYMFLGKLFPNFNHDGKVALLVAAFLLYLAA